MKRKVSTLGFDIEDISAVPEVDGAVPLTPIYVVNGTSVTDPWSGHALERADGSTAGLLRLATRAGRPIDVKANGDWVRVWPDGTILPVREPAALARRKALRKQRWREVRRQRAKARMTALGRSVRDKVLRRRNDDDDAVERE
ncbi:Hypothetical protein AAM4_2621 [Actinomyces succiniciruminis]|uniref:Uncharacterized protein n=2 Tax=Actinomyces succiniciruminis TaxID=1522002 RepID=A0A1L7RT96_9ACTO|nr:Hypothetical protein AAM4_2621 [Actinomyces succiniciruminis]